MCDEEEQDASELEVFLSSSATFQVYRSPDIRQRDDSLGGSRHEQAASYLDPQRKGHIEQEPW